MDVLLRNHTHMMVKLDCSNGQLSLLDQLVMAIRQCEICFSVWVLVTLMERKQERLDLPQGK